MKAMPDPERTCPRSLSERVVFGPAVESKLIAVYYASGENSMNQSISRRQFLQASAIAGAGLALPKNRIARLRKKSVLIFTKSSGFEHEVIKTTAGHPSILEQAVKTSESNMALT